jgi:uncharacterized protein DUF6602
MKAYNKYAELLSKKFNSRLEDILPDYNFDYGVEFEIALCEILRAFLPEKYGVCRGHIVNYNGDSVGDDIIIYDQQSFPTIRLHNKQQFARKENIPVEAVYAYFEAKHNLTEDTFNTALGQIRTVKDFVSKRKRIQIETFDPYLEPIDRETNYSKNYPDYRNPIYCGIISRKTALTKERIEELEKEFENSKKDINNPETIIFSKSKYMQIGHDEEDGFQPTVFLLENKAFSYSVIQTSEDLSFGLGLINLISAIDWIRLGRIDWIKVLNYYIQNKSENNN